MSNVTQSCQLKCKVMPGMFSSELIATIPTVESGTGARSQARIFADKVCFVSIDGDNGRLRATRIGKGLQKDTVVVVLPQPTFQNGPTVLVPKAIVD